MNKWMTGTVLALAVWAGGESAQAAPIDMKNRALIKGSDYVIEESYDQTTQKSVYHFVNDETGARVLAPLDSTYDVSIIAYGEDVLIERSRSVERVNLTTGESTQITSPQFYQAIVDTDVARGRILLKMNLHEGVVIDLDGNVLHRFTGESSTFLDNGDVLVSGGEKTTILDAVTFVEKDSFAMKSRLARLYSFKEEGTVLVRTEEGLYFYDDKARTLTYEAFASEYHIDGVYMYDGKMYLINRMKLTTYDRASRALTTEPLEYSRNGWLSVAATSRGLLVGDRLYGGEDVYEFPKSISLNVSKTTKNWYTNIPYTPELVINTLGGEILRPHVSETLLDVPANVKINDGFEITSPGKVALTFTTAGLTFPWTQTFYDYVPITVESSGTLTEITGKTAPNVTVWVAYRQFNETKFIGASVQADAQGVFRHELGTTLFAGGMITVSHSTDTSLAEKVEITTTEREAFDNGVTLVSLSRYNGAVFKTTPGEVVEITYNDPYMLTGATAVADASGIARFTNEFPKGGRVYYKKARDVEEAYKLETVKEDYGLPTVDVTDVLLMKTNAVFTVKKEASASLRFLVNGQAVTVKQLSPTRYQLPVKPGATVTVRATNRTRTQDETIVLPATVLSQLKINNEISSWTGIFLPNSAVTLTSPNGVVKATASSTGRVTLRFPRFTTGQAVTLLSQDGRFRHQQKMAVTEGIAPSITVGALTSTSRSVSVKANVNYGTITVSRGTTVLATRNVTTTSSSLAIAPQRKGTKLTVKLVTPRGKTTTKTVYVK
ncbi:hypothetical protein [Exiguobacterium sp. TNDT2]|uniref:hypothetical protein n=1 Tax=Exiguobacterium sp. TNDT2 TaxID=2233531 RepID=UPI0013003E56|nr:hypothetical protein [Exiguobacterium sp. TNDT2]